MPENETREIKQEHTEERGSAHTKYYLDLGTFEDVTEGAYKNSQEGKVQNPFKWKVIEEYDNFDDAYKGYRAYINKQMNYDRNDLTRIWANGRIDIRLRHGPKMLDWNAMYVREANPEEEDAKTIKGKDPIEAQEESKKDSLAFKDTEFYKTFVLDSVEDIIEPLEEKIKSALETNIYNSSASVEISDIRTKERFSKEFFAGKLSATIVVKGQIKKDNLMRLMVKSISSVRNINNTILTLTVSNIEPEEIYSGQDDLNTVKYNITGTVNGHESVDANPEASGAKPTSEIFKQDKQIIESMSTQLEQIGIKALKERASGALSKANDKVKDEARERFSRALKALELAERMEGEERDELLESAYQDLTYVIILSEVTQVNKPGEPNVGGDLSAKHSEKMSEGERLNFIRREISNTIRKAKRAPSKKPAERIDPYKNSVKSARSKEQEERELSEYNKAREAERENHKARVINPRFKSEETEAGMKEASERLKNLSNK